MSNLDVSLIEKRKVYLFHQTPKELCPKLISYVPLINNDVILEPFRGEGAFFDSLPSYTKNEWCEIEKGKCYTSYNEKIDWVITNPPFRLDSNDGKRVNAFYYLLNYFLKKVNKGVCFLANFNCWNSLTPKRLDEIKALGFYLSNVVVCNVKKWSGRYYFLIFTKSPNTFLHHILGSF